MPGHVSRPPIMHPDSPSTAPMTALPRMPPPAWDPRAGKATAHLRKSPVDEAPLRGGGFRDVGAGRVWSYSVPMWRVLIVDDSATYRETIQAALEPFGMEFGHAADGHAAVAAATHEPWDLIFLDITMPLLDGPAALAAIRGMGITTQVVLISSTANASAITPAVRLGGVNYLAKPFTPEQVRTYAAKALKQDAAVLGTQPRVLLQHTDPAVAASLRQLLPRHVQLETSHALAQSLDLAERSRAAGRPLDLVILESRELADEMEAVAGVLRRALPAAGLFVVSDDATDATLWQPTDAIDGLLPRALDASVIRDILYGLFLRPQVLFFGQTARVAGFRGDAALRDAYLARVTRMLLTHAGNNQTAELTLDVSRVPGGLDALASVVATLDTALRATGAAAAFRTRPEHRLAVTQRLPRIIIE